MLKAKKEKELTFSEIGDVLGLDEIWVASLFYGQASASEEENTGFSASYTMGSMSLTAFANKVNNAGGTAGVSKEAKGVTVAFSF